MSSYLGDIKLGDTLDFKFTTVQTTGAPFTLAGTPVISAYPSNSTTEITAGITLTVDFDSRTGLNHVRVVASGGNGYAVATNYELVITTGTVNSVSVVGYVIGTFSIQNRLGIATTQLTEGYAADGTAPTIEQALFLLIAALTEFAISGTTITAKKLDGSTTAATFTINDATNPTSRTRAT
jgi:hypothetical protein